MTSFGALVLGETFGIKPVFNFGLELARVRVAVVPICDFAASRNSDRVTVGEQRGSSDRKYLVGWDSQNGGVIGVENRRHCSSYFRIGIAW